MTKSKTKPKKTNPPPERSPSPDVSASRWASWWVCTVIAGAIIASFWPTFKNRFVDWDDTGMFLENFNYRSLGWENIKWMFTTTYYAHYHPITWITLALDYQFWKLNPTGYHLGNLIFHCLNAVLFYFLSLRILRRANPNAAPNFQLLRLGGGMAALFFAVHPLRVESVAWATERRDVVSGFFYLLTLLAYFRAHDDEPRRRRWLTITLILFVCSFLSKAWGITLPIVLLVLDVYPLHRIKAGPEFSKQLRKAIFEKAFFFLVAIGLGLIAFLGQSQWGIKAADFSLSKRVMNAAYGLVFYPWKTFVPVNLSPIYPLDPNFNPWETPYVFCLLAGIGITVTVFLLRKRWPSLLAAWICYAVIVSSVLGIAQSGEQIAADRYTYLSCLPFAILVGGWGITLLGRAQKPAVLIGVLLGAGLCGLLGKLTFEQTKIWHDNLSLWNQALKADPNNFIARNGRGKVYLDARQWDNALDDFNTAIRLNPKRVASYTNRGYVYYYQGKFDEALADFNKSLELQPEHQTYNNRGALRENKGDIDGAIADYSSSIQLAPNAIAYSNRARLRQRQRDFRGAFQDYSMALRVEPTNAEAWQGRGNIRFLAKDFVGAAADFANALNAAPPNWPARATVTEQLAGAQNAVKKAP